MVDQSQWSLEFSKDGTHHLAAGVGEVAGEDKDEDEVRGGHKHRIATFDVSYADKKATTNGIAPTGGKVEPQEQKVKVATKTQKTCRWRVIRCDTANS